MWVSLSSFVCQPTHRRFISFMVNLDTVLDMVDRKDFDGQLQNRLGHQKRLAVEKEERNWRPQQNCFLLWPDHVKGVQKKISLSEIMISRDLGSTT